MPLWLQIVLPIVTLILGGVAGLFIARKLVTKQIEENPPFNEDMIRAMYKSMGRTPSQAQVNNTMRAIKAVQKQQVNKK